MLVARFPLQLVVNGDEGEDEDDVTEVGHIATATTTLHLTDGTFIPNTNYALFGTGYAYCIPFVRIRTLHPSPPHTTNPNRGGA
jgi:hypothetical protein